MFHYLKLSSQLNLLYKHGFFWLAGFWKYGEGHQPLLAGCTFSVKDHHMRRSVTSCCQHDIMSRNKWMCKAGMTGKTASLAHRYSHYVAKRLNAREMWAKPAVADFFKLCTYFSPRNSFPEGSMINTIKREKWAEDCDWLKTKEKGGISECDLQLEGPSNEDTVLLC